MKKTISTWSMLNFRWCDNTEIEIPARQSDKELQTKYAPQCCWHKFDTEMEKLKFKNQGGECKE